jgi:hypothetical protein
MAALPSRAADAPGRNKHASAHATRCVATIIITIVITVIISNSSEMNVFAVAHTAPNPWLLMMEDTKSVLIMLQRFPYIVPAESAPAAVALSHGLLSLKTRNSNLCTAAYGGYNGALLNPNITTDFSTE